VKRVLAVRGRGLGQRPRLSPRVSALRATTERMPCLQKSVSDAVHAPTLDSNSGWNTRRARSEKRSLVTTSRGDFLACLWGDLGLYTEKKLHFLCGSAELRDNEQKDLPTQIEKSPAAVER